MSPTPAPERRPCRRCETLFPVTRSDRVFCSRSCQALHWQETHPEHLAPKLQARKDKRAAVAAKKREEQERREQAAVADLSTVATIKQLHRAGCRLQFIADTVGVTKQRVSYLLRTEPDPENSS